MATLICPECNAVVHTKSKRSATCMRCKHKVPVCTFDDPAFDEVIDILRDADFRIHLDDDNGPCLCSQCEWARKVIASLSKYS